MSKAFLRVSSKIVAHGDTAPSSNNARRKYVDWDLNLDSLEVDDPISRGYTLAPGDTLTLFDGTRSLSTANDSEFAIELVDGSSDTYRLRWTGGTNPVFRTNRNLDLSGATVDVQVNDNATVTISVTSGSLTGMVAGDSLWIPDTDEAPDQPFHVGNRGFWVVMSATSTSAVLRRDGDFQAHGETGVEIDDAGQFIAFSAAGVQASDTLDILDGFVEATRKTYPVTDVTPAYIEFQSPQAVAEEAAIVPSADGIAVYTDAKRFVHIESDQEIVVRANGDSSSSQRVQPPKDAGDAQVPGVYMRVGVTYSLTVVSRSTVAANVVLISCR